MVSPISFVHNAIINRFQYPSGGYFIIQQYKFVLVEWNKKDYILTAP